jgi:hypothetical protein
MRDHLLGLAWGAAVGGGLLSFVMWALPGESFAPTAIYTLLPTALGVVGIAVLSRRAEG